MVITDPVPSLKSRMSLIKLARNTFEIPDSWNLPLLIRDNKF